MNVEQLIVLGGGVERLAQRLGVSRATIYDWRRNRRISAARLPQICKTLRIPPEELLRITQPPRKRV